MDRSVGYNDAQGLVLLVILLIQTYGRLYHEEPFVLITKECC